MPRSVQGARRPPAALAAGRLSAGKGPPSPHAPRGRRRPPAALAARYLPARARALWLSTWPPTARRPSARGPWRPPTCAWAGAAPAGPTAAAELALAPAAARAPSLDGAAAHADGRRAPGQAAPSAAGRLSAGKGAGPLHAPRGRRPARGSMADGPTAVGRPRRPSGPPPDMAALFGPPAGRGCVEVPDYASYTGF